MYLRWTTSAPLKTGRELRMKESHRKDPASHPDPSHASAAVRTQAKR